MATFDGAGCRAARSTESIAVDPVGNMDSLRRELSFDGR